MSNQTLTATPEEMTRVWELRELRESPVGLLRNIASELEIDVPREAPKRDIVYKILQKQIDREGKLFTEGVLEVLPDGFGFLRGADASLIKETIGWEPTTDLDEGLEAVFRWMTDGGGTQ